MTEEISSPSPTVSSGGKGLRTYYSELNSKNVLTLPKGFKIPNPYSFILPSSTWVRVSWSPMAELEAASPRRVQRGERKHSPAMISRSLGSRFTVQGRKVFTSRATSTGVREDKNTSKFLMSLSISSSGSTSLVVGIFFDTLQGINKQKKRSLMSLFEKDEFYRQQK